MISWPGSGSAGLLAWSLVMDVWSAVLVAAALLVPGSLLVFSARSRVFPTPLEDRNGSGREERLLLITALVPATSIVVLILLGLVMSALHVPLGRWSWALGLCAVTAALIVILAVRGDLGPLGRLPLLTLWTGSVSTYVLVGLGIVALGASFYLDVWGAKNLGAERVTELWVLPGERAGTIAVAVRNAKEPHEVCRLRIEWPGGKGHRAIGPFRLSSGHTWMRSVHVPPRVRGRIRLTLTAATNEATLSRRVSITYPTQSREGRSAAVAYTPHSRAHISANANEWKGKGA